MTIQPEQVPEKVVIGVLGRFIVVVWRAIVHTIYSYLIEALQGAFIEHIHYLQRSITHTC